MPWGRSRLVSYVSAAFAVEDRQMGKQKRRCPAKSENSLVERIGVVVAVHCTLLLAVEETWPFRTPWAFSPTLGHGVASGKELGDYSWWRRRS